jgi:uncharacterized membrane protein YoaK (UPF0700 family)
VARVIRKVDPLPIALAVLTILSGLLDAASYLGLGHVFTANMTGNIVVLGFAAAGAPGFSAPACLASLAAFLVGAGAAGRLSPQLRSRRAQLLTTLAVETVMVAAAVVVAAVAGGAGRAGVRYALIILLALAMGMRNATVRRIAIPDMTTTVLTLTLTGLAFDMARGVFTSQTTRRVVSVTTMLLGAYVGALLLLHDGIAWPLGVGAGCAALTALGFAVHPRSREEPPAKPA